MTSILLVEDHAIMADAIARVLREKGHFDVAAVARSAEEAREKLTHTKVDMVLVDVSLPKMNGIELVTRLHEEYPDLPCVMLSGHSASQYVARSLSAGARGYVLKEDMLGLLDGVAEVLAGRIYLSKGLRDEPVPAEPAPRQNRPS